MRQDWRRPETAISACANFFSRYVLTNFAKFFTLPSKGDEYGDHEHIAACTHERMG
ncbi:hypothetical protein AGR4A_Cc50130 [Agrobacterium tumefaciens str. B6]|uniref:Uncharacterized protein n=1 Tax=Agrobacterium tumefaciens str. B6 TaxID=1183423 RepID=A0A822V4T0_AGRTU|nr:hypothetical protein AGR4B_Cc70171 [Agrobacterium tumefaciens str. CFBP 5621]CVI19084.1 hypothetical protein AGR4A_Cc50130 [Agrobacterium tumefaciens str. B6]